MLRTRITCPLDLDQDGKQVGHLRMPHSSNVSAYGWIGIPMAVIKNGSGPTVYLGAGNHGDEYEGQVTLVRLIRELDPATIQGRLIILPAQNLPAAMNHSRCSPIDGANLNRSFPGEPDAPDHRPTAAIAHYIAHALLPMCDAVIDLHSGGKTLDYVPSALIRRTPADDLFARSLAALKAFGAPIGYIVEGGSPTTGAGSDRPPTLGGHAESQGIMAIGTELGGAGTLTPTTLGVARRGVYNFLAHLGVLEDNPYADMGETTRLVTVGGPDYYVHSPCRGVFEPAFALGDEVEEDQLCGLIHHVDDPAQPPREVRFARSGVAFCKRPITGVDRGDCLAHLGSDWDG